MKIKANSGDYLSWLADKFWTPQIICARFDFDGRIDEKRLLNAWTRTAYRIPVIRSLMRLHENEPHFEVLEIKDFSDYLSVVADVDADTAKKLEHKFITESINHENSPPVRMWLHHRPLGDRLIVKTQHTALDGGGFKFALEELADCYRSDSNTPPENENPLSTERSEEQIFGALNPRHKFTIARRAIISAFTGGAFSGDNSIWMDGVKAGAYNYVANPQLRKIVLKPARFEAFRDFCRGQNTTVNTGLLCTMGVAISKWNSMHGVKRKKYILSHTADLRALAPAISGKHITGVFSNLSGGEALSLHSDSLSDLKTAISSLRPRMDAVKRKFPGAHSIYLFSKLSLGFPPRVSKRWMFPIARQFSRAFKRTFTLTNIGVIDIKAGDYGNAKANAAFIWAPIFPARHMYVSASSYRSVLTLTLGYDGAALSENAWCEFEKTFLAALDETLE